MKTKNTLLVLTLSSLLVACGSSSHKGTQAPSGGIKSDENIAGKLADLGVSMDSSAGNFVAVADKQSHKLSADLAEGFIIVDGKKIMLNDEKAIFGKTGSDNAMIGMHYDVTNHEAIYFAVGKMPTEKMPDANGVVYKGTAIDSVESAKKRGVGSMPAQFTVNFADHKLKGEIGGASHGNVVVKANIDGNTFKGKYDFSANMGDVSVKGSTYVAGGFFGEDASDMAGAYAREGTHTNGKDIIDLKTSGVFQAEKQ